MFSFIKVIKIPRAKGLSVSKWVSEPPRKKKIRTLKKMDIHHHLQIQGVSKQSLTCGFTKYRHMI